MIELQKIVKDNNKSMIPAKIADFIKLRFTPKGYRKIKRVKVKKIFYRIRTIQDIKDLVINHFEMEWDFIISHSRKRRIVHARQSCIWLLRKHSRVTLVEIGIIMGARDHTTIRASIKTITDLMDVDIAVQEEIYFLSQKLNVS